MQGDIHNYLGMTMYYSKHGKVVVDMTEYIQTRKMIDLPKNFNGTAVKPAANHIFEVDKNCLKLKNKNQNYSTTSQLNYSSL